MDSKLKEAIEALAEKAKGAEKSDDAQRFAQAALNLAHTFATFDNAKK
jgi:hypothetical protein